MRILVKEKNAIISDTVFQRQPLHVGSQPECAVHLPDMRVRLHHAVLSPMENGDWIIDHVGDAEIYVNGHRLSHSLRIANGDQVAIVDYTLNLYLDLDEQSVKLPGKAATVSKAEQYPVPHGTVTRSKRDSALMTSQQVDSLSRFALELGDCRDLAAVMEGVLRGLFQRFRARAVWLGIRRQGRGPLEMIQGRDFNGQVYDTPKLLDALRYRCVERGMSVWVPTPVDDTVGAIIAAPILSTYGRLGFVYLDSRKDTPFSEGDFEHLIALSTAIGHQMDASIREQLNWRRAMSSAESSIVQGIQSKLDPRVIPEWSELQVAVHANPGQERCGDLYDIMQLPNGAAAFFVGHVYAEAVTAAITMIEARTMFRSAVLHADMPHVMLQELNWLLCAKPETVRMQGGVVLVDPKNGAMLHALAGPSCALVIGLSGEPRRLDPGEAPLMGNSANFPYRTRKGILGENETLAMYTPGLTKLQDDNGRELCEQPFLDSLCDGFGAPARKALNETLSDLSPYFEKGYQPEDVVILLAHRQANEPN